MAPHQSLPVAALDTRTSRHVVLGHRELTFDTEEAAQAAGCIVVRGRNVALGVVAGAIGGLSPTERATPAPKCPPVITRIPGTVQRPPRATPTPAAKQPDAPRSRRR